VGRPHWKGQRWEVHPLRYVRTYGPEPRTLQELGRQADVSWQHVAAIEAGDRGASPQVWMRLAHALGVTVDRIKPPEVPADPRQLEIPTGGPVIASVRS
jgi:hypothetical protein